MKYQWTETAYIQKEIVKTEHSGESCMDNGQENQAVNLYPEFTYQTFEGFGGAMTEAAAYTWHTMSEKTKKEFMAAYFGSDGLGYTQGRMSLDSCDACLGNFSAMDDENDTEMKSFSIARDEKYILPFWEAANKASSSPLQIMISPWSPPPFMKTNGEKNHGGKLKEEYRSMWAKYFCKFIEAYQAKGVNVKRISIQNEPAAVQIWDSCVYTAEDEKVFLRDYLYPEMKAHGLDDIEIFIWDHNKERALERALATIDKDTDAMVDGIAFHWYSGDHFEALSMLKERFPDKKLAFTEGCVEYSKFSGKDQLADARMYGHDISGDLNNGASLFIDWCVLLNKIGGPNHVNNFVDTPIMYDADTDTMEKKLSYHYIGHFSRAIVPGSVRIGYSKYTDKIDVAAFKRPDGKLAVVIMNRRSEAMPVYIRMKGEVMPVTVSGDAIATVLIG